MRVEFRCGCRAVWDERRGAVCPVHGALVLRAIDPPAPRIRGTASGPLVQTAQLAPVAVDLASGGALTLKTETTTETTRGQ